MFRPLESIPVLAKAGSIIPMNGEKHLKNGADLPENILLRLFPEADGETELIEDNGLLPQDPDYRCVMTRIRMRRGRDLTVEILPPEGDASLLPPGRTFTVELNGAANAGPDSCTCAFTSVYDMEHRALRLALQASSCSMTWKAYAGTEAPDRTDLIRKILLQAQISYDLKWEIMSVVGRPPDPAVLMAELNTMPLPASLRGAVLEILNAF